jgi:3-oxoadipate enol-lactonase
MIIKRDGVALYAVVEGDGEPVVLLHGHTLDLRVWDEVVPELVAAGLRAIRYDQRGHGRSASPPSGYRWGDHAADLAEVIGRVAGGPAHLVGLSKGGGIALELAVRRPELVRSLTVIGPLVPDAPLPADMVASFKAVARAIRADGPAAVTGEVWLAHPLIASAAARPGARERLEAMLRTFPAGEYLATARDVPDREWQLTDRLAEITAPTLVVRGEHEVSSFVSVAQLLETVIPNARLITVSDSGHLVPLEQPSATAAVLTRFIAPESQF